MEKILNQMNFKDLVLKECLTHLFLLSNEWVIHYGLSWMLSRAITGIKYCELSIRRGL